jgi:FAD/FMN-containing dehydrogenase
MPRSYPISRRHFLAGAGGLALAASVASPTSLVAADRRPSRRKRLSPAAWRDLSASLDGRLIRPGEAGFNATALPWNLAYAEERPQAIALVESAFDVQRCVQWATRTGVPLVARSGGHSYAGYSTSPGLIVDLSHMNQITDNGDGSASVAAGAPLGNVDTQLTADGVILPAGRCASVGVAGLALGGGFGFNSRKFGLTSDNLIDTEIVTADGELRRVDESSDADLLWALKGGGGGNFGINTSFRFRIYQVDTVAVYSLSWSIDDAVGVVSTLQQISLGSPDEFSLHVAIGVDDAGATAGATNLSLQAIGQYIGSISDLQELLAPALAVATPTSSTIEQMSLAAGTSFLGEQGKPDAFLTKSAFLPVGLSDASIEQLVAALHSFPVAGRDGCLVLFGYGGVVNDVAPDATAYPHRSAGFMVEGNASWHPGDAPSVVAATKAWMQELWLTLEPDFDGTAYQNFIDPTLEDWQTAYYGDNLERLIEVKKQVDPTDFFHFAQSIPVRSASLS